MRAFQYFCNKIWSMCCSLPSDLLYALVRVLVLLLDEDRARDIDLLNIADPHPALHSDTT